MQSRWGLVKYQDTQRTWFKVVNLARFSTNGGKVLFEDTHYFDALLSKEWAVHMTSCGHDITEEDFA